MADAKSKPCPFCGSSIPLVCTNEEYNRFRITCTKCFALTDWFETEEEAVSAWNKRTAYEDDEWFYLPKPKEAVVQFGSPQIKKTENGYEAEQPIEIINSAIRAWGDELGEYVMKRICEVWNGTCYVIGSATVGLCTDKPQKYFALSCGHCFTLNGLITPTYCLNCGRKVQTK